ncbi:MAG TPA: 30S ribosomal protein S12 methylthiotransferase RimO [Phycisphaerae bacterium]|nr:30S ribosomal protein S12 methylthiotransferase RimO [Phycisphaerae bacterium]
MDPVEKVAGEGDELRTERRQAAAPKRRAGAAAPPVVGFVSLGCVKNLVDSEKMLAQIAEAGALISGDEDAADTIVVNTCGFLQAARAEVLEVLEGLVQRKRRGELKRIVVAGCLVQRDGAKLLEAVPEIDALVGVHNRHDVARAVMGSPDPTERAAGFSPRDVAQRTASSRPVDLYVGEYHSQPWSDRGRLRLTPRHYAYVRISEGCSQKCTFCTIPAIRGPMHCKPPDEIAAECRELVAAGARELILIGQDTTSYGADIGYQPGLAGLLRKLDAECDGAKWIRLMYAYPSVMTGEMLAAIAECDRVVKYIDLPLQHINDRVLRAMHRRVTRKRTERLLEKIRRQIPGVTIRTTFMVGFPGETEAEFQELLDFVRDFGFDALGAFKYSLEPDTPAGRMRNQLDEAVKQARYERLMLTQQGVALRAARRRVGQTLDVVVDASDGERGIVARHAGQAPDVDSVCLLKDGVAEPGEFLSARCVDVDGYDLVIRPGRRRPRAVRGI